MVIQREGEHSKEDTIEDMKSRNKVGGKENERGGVKDVSTQR